MKQKASGVCRSCERRLLVTRSKPNHILHLILTLLTGGLWIIVWIGVSVQFGGWRCSVCGSKSVNNIC